MRVDSRERPGPLPTGMTHPPGSLLRMILELPAIGEKAAFRKGPLELRLENHHGGLCVLSGRAESEQRHFLGLPEAGQLELLVRAPEHRVKVLMRDRLTLASGGRLHGYVTVPMPHRLVWRSAKGAVEPLLEVAPKELAMSWLGEGPEGGYVHDCGSSFHLERQGICADTMAIVPVVLWNDGEHMITPESLTLSIRDRDLREFDGQIVTSPRRLRFVDGGPVSEEIRGIPRRSA